VLLFIYEQKEKIFRRLPDEKKIELIAILQKYYELKDIVEGGNLFPIFNDLYASEERLSYDEIALKYSVGLSTLKRYIDRFNNAAISTAQKLDG